MARYKSIEDYRHRTKLKRLLRNLLVSFLLVAVLLGLLFAFDAFRGSPLDDFLDSARGEDGGRFPVTMKKEQLLNICPVGKELAALTKSSLLIYDKNGERGELSPHGYTNPVMKAGNDRILTYDRGGSRLRVDNAGGKLYEIATESDIITAQISQGGRVAVSMRYTANTPVIAVYDNQMELIYRYIVAEDFAGVAFSEDENRLTLTAISSPEGLISAKLYTLDIMNSKATPVQTVVEDILPVASAGRKGGGVRLVGKNSAVFTVPGGGERRFEYEGALRHYAFWNDGLLLANQNPLNSYSILTLLDKEGAVAQTAGLEDDTLDIVCGGDKAYVLGKKAVYRYNSSLTIEKEYPLEQSYQRIVSLGEAFYLMGEDTIAKLAAD